MKKSFIPFLLAGVLSTTSCTESFEPTVDYGDQTHINDYSALLAAVNNLNKSMSERFEALNQLLDKNLADIKLSIDANTGAIKAIGDNVDTINTTLLNGFSALSAQIDATGKQIVYAINENGEMLRLEIDANGKLISSKIEALDASLKAIVDAINSQTTKLEAKFDGLNTLIKQGFVDVIAKIGEVGDVLHLDLTKIDEKLGKIDADMLAGFTNLGTKIDTNGNKIVTAIDANGDKLELVINANGAVISTAIKDFHDDYTTNEAEQLAKMAEIIDAIKTLTDANNANAAEIIEKLNTILNSNKIYLDPNDEGSIYMTPGKFQRIEEAGENSNIYKLYVSKIEAFAPAVDKVQVVDEAGFIAGGEASRPPEDGSNNGISVDGFTHDHAIFTAHPEKDQSILVQKGDAKVEPFSNGQVVVRIIRTALTCNYSVTIIGGGGCSFPNIYKVKIGDAEGVKYIDSNGTKHDVDFGTGNTNTTIDFKLVVYTKAAGTVDKVTAFAYCLQNKVIN